MSKQCIGTVKNRLYNNQYQCNCTATMGDYCHLHHPDAVEARRMASEARLRVKELAQPSPALKIAQERVQELEGAIRQAGRLYKENPYYLPEIIEGLVKLL